MTQLLNSSFENQNDITKGCIFNDDNFRYFDGLHNDRAPDNQDIYAQSDSFDRRRNQHYAQNRKLSQFKLYELRQTSSPPSSSSPVLYPLNRKQIDFDNPTTREVIRQRQIDDYAKPYGVWVDCGTFRYMAGVRNQFNATNDANYSPDFVFNFQGQSVQIGVAAIVKSILMPPESWTAETIDIVLSEGDRLYGETFAAVGPNGKATDSTTIQYTNKVFQAVDHKIEIISPTRCGAFAAEYKAHVGHGTSGIGLKEAFDRWDRYDARCHGGAIICGGKGRAFFKSNRKYYLFDSYSSIIHRHACLFETDNLFSIYAIMLQLLGVGDTFYFEVDYLIVKSSNGPTINTINLANVCIQTDPDRALSPSSSSSSSSSLSSLSSSLSSPPPSPSPSSPSPSSPSPSSPSPSSSPSSPSPSSPSPSSPSSSSSSSTFSDCSHTSQNVKNTKKKRHYFIKRIVRKVPYRVGRSNQLMCDERGYLYVQEKIQSTNSFNINKGPNKYYRCVLARKSGCHMRLIVKADGTIVVSGRAMAHSCLLQDHLKPSARKRRKNST